MTTEDMTHNPEATERYFAELALSLKHEGLNVLPADNGLLPVELDGQHLCTVTGSGGVRWQYSDDKDKDCQAALDKVIDITRTTAEYMRKMEAAPKLTTKSPEGDYRLLAEFNDRVLAGHPTKYGVQFITWEQIHNGTVLYQGHYFGPSTGADSYTDAKQDFALRSGLVPRSAIFSPEQLTEVYRCINETLENNCITPERQKLLESASEQIERAVPDLDERVELSMQKEEEYDTPEHQRGGYTFLLE